MNNLFFILLTFLPFLVMGQEHMDVAHEGHHEKVHHTKDIIEIITTGIRAKPFGEGEAIWGTEAHLTYWFVHAYGTGFSYTLRSEEGELLNDIALLASWNPNNWLTLNVGPNFALPNNHREFALLAYAEAEINFRLREWFHIGPVVGTLLGKHSEYSLGLHLGFEIHNPALKHK
ncbi:MAG: hypothetical protein MRZ79_25120 [Bacteroidia bacterium]|nr:hypothetical protein [Bacteroidia bacterium]